MTFKSESIFKQIETSLSSNPSLAKELVKKTNSVIVFNLKNKQGEQKAWSLDLKKEGKLKQGNTEGADLTINLSDLDFKKLVNGKSNSQKLFLSGKLKVKGDVMKAANIEKILKAVAPAKAKL
jgi:putative sterol carrier protein